MLLLGVLLRRGPRWPHSLGLLAGAGTGCLMLAVIAAVAGPAWWAVIGVALAGASVGAFCGLRCRPIIR
jgi:hypothetical protein